MIPALANRCWACLGHIAQTLRPLSNVLTGARAAVRAISLFPSATPFQRHFRQQQHPPVPARYKPARHSRVRSGPSGPARSVDIGGAAIVAEMHRVPKHTTASPKAQETCPAHTQARPWRTMNFRMTEIALRTAAWPASSAEIRTRFLQYPVIVDRQRGTKTTSSGLQVGLQYISRSSLWRHSALPFRLQPAFGEDRFGSRRLRSPNLPNIARQHLAIQRTAPDCAG